jgi:hypothetical protein
MSSRMQRLADQYRRELREAAARPCPMGVGCDEVGVCYASAHGEAARCPKHVRQPRGVGPWLNWYVNRGIIPLEFTAKDLRRISHRRTF